MPSIGQSAASQYPNAKEFRMFRELVRQSFGLDLRDGKEQLVSARLHKLMRGLNIDSFEAYYRHVTTDSTGEALTDLIDALTTNHTSFFREKEHFVQLSKYVGHRLESRSNLRIWSAACSTGEEPYSIAFTLHSSHVLGACNIIASDISTRVLSQARTGIYPAERLEGLSRDCVREYFLKGVGPSEGKYRVKPEFTSKVEFCRVNLIEDARLNGQFDVIFCRNVMIYFDKNIQQRVVTNLIRKLAPGGLLFIGHSESLSGLSHGLSYVAPATYKKDGN